MRGKNGKAGCDAYTADVVALHVLVSTTKVYLCYSKEAQGPCENGSHGVPDKKVVCSSQLTLNIQPPPSLYRPHYLNANTLITLF